jgi:hypothetical protein
MLSMILQWMHPALAAAGDRALAQEQKPGSNQSSKPNAKKVDTEIAIKLRIRIEGPDAYAAMREIERLIQSWFDEEQL